MLSGLYKLIFPQTCLNCHQSLSHAENYLCMQCKLDLPYTDDHTHSSNDLMSKFSFEPKIVSAGAFLYFQKEGIVQRLLYAIKYQGKRELGYLMGQWYGSVLGDLSVDIIIPVPLHKVKKRKRGFNQSERIANGLSDELDIPVNGNIIGRKVKTASQTRKSKLERWQNVENIYTECKKDLTDQSLLVVDDVVTTGATIGMLCERLVEANAREIHIVCLARGK